VTAAISVGAQNDWLFLSLSTSLSPFAFAPEEQGSLEEGKARVVATFGGRVLEDDLIYRAGTNSHGQAGLRGSAYF
jgi:hypothetical protein